MAALGFNPLNWDCKRRGCANLKTRPKLELFAGCFPGRNNFGDLDGVVEHAGALCLLEWKTPRVRLKTAQAITFRNITSDKCSVVFVVEGDAETMTVERYSVFWKGKQQRWQKATFHDLKARITSWAGREWALGQAPGRRILRGDVRQCS